MSLPLDGFRIMDWASTTFGGLPPVLIGGFGVATLITGVIMVVAGARLLPASWGLISAGVATAALTYFIVGAAISGTGSLQGGENVAHAAPRFVPVAVSVIAFGLAMFTGRLAFRSWASEENSGKASAVVLIAAMCGLFFVGVQVVRGSFMDIQQPSENSTDSESTDDESSEPEPVRRGVTAPRHR